MLATSLAAALLPAVVLSTAIPPVSKGFPPDHDSFTWNDTVYNLPLPYNFSSLQTRGEVQIDGIFWVNSFIHGSDGHDYYIASHVMNYASDIPGALPIYRASLLDITDVSYYDNFLYVTDPNATFWSENGDFSAVFPGFGMETTNSSDPLQGIRTYTSLDGIEFDLTFNFTSPAFLHAGMGTYYVGGGYGHEWSVPRAATEGWLTVRGERVDIIPEKSSTWYDRQWGTLSDGFQWLMLHFEESEWLDMTILCIWDWDDAVNGPKSFGTIRNPKTGTDSLISVLVEASTTNIFTSPDTGNVYPQEWVVKLGDVEIFVKSPRADQVIETDPSTGFPPQFSGYVDVVAKKAGHRPVKGYGAVDFMKIG